MKEADNIFPGNSECEWVKNLEDWQCCPGQEKNAQT